MLKLKHCLLVTVALTSISSCVDFTIGMDGIMDGDYACTRSSPHANKITFHSSEVVSATWGTTDNPYITLKKEGEDVNLYHSEGWICRTPDERIIPLIQFT